MTEIDDILSEQPPQPGGGLSLASIVLLVGVLLAVGTIGWAFLHQSNEQPEQGRAPNFTVTTFDGQEITLNEQQGTIVVLNFWGSWCAPCRDEAPHLQAVHDAYLDDGVLILGVTYLDDQADSLAFINELALTYPNAPDPGTKIAEDRYHIDGAPETFVIDREGNIAHFFYGPVTEESLSEVLDNLLTEEGV